MTDLTSIKQALAEATKGRWCQFHPGYCEEAVGTPIVDWDTSHDMSAVEDGKRTKRIATFKHAADAAYVDAVQPVIMRDFIASHEQLEAENAALKAERDRLERNRDMWKGQVERQATTLQTMREALQGLEWACEQLAATRSHEIYRAMIDGGQTEALLYLDARRRATRSALSTGQETDNG